MLVDASDLLHMAAQKHSWEMDSDDRPSRLQEVDDLQQKRRAALQRQTERLRALQEAQREAGQRRLDPCKHQDPFSTPDPSNYWLNCYPSSTCCHLRWDTLPNCVTSTGRRSRIPRPVTEGDLKNNDGGAAMPTRFSAQEEKEADFDYLIPTKPPAGLRRTFVSPTFEEPRNGTILHQIPYSGEVEFGVTVKPPVPRSSGNSSGHRRGTVLSQGRAGDCGLTTKSPAPKSVPGIFSGLRRGTSLHPVVPGGDVDCGHTVKPQPAPKSAPDTLSGPRRRTFNRLASDSSMVKPDLHPLNNPSQSLTDCFSQLESDDWRKKVEGLQTIQALARHHAEQLKPKLHEVCPSVTEEVKNVRSVVVCAAIDTVRELHVHLDDSMDLYAGLTGNALLLKMNKTTNKFIRQQVNLALDALVEGCSPGVVLSTLLKVGPSHRDPAVRGSTALHLLQLTEMVGENWFFTSGKRFVEQFLTTVSKMPLDASPEVRHYGKKILERLAHHKQFLALWTDLVPEMDRGGITLPQVTIEGEGIQDPNIDHSPESCGQILLNGRRGGSVLRPTPPCGSSECNQTGKPPGPGSGPVIRSGSQCGRVLDPVASNGTAKPDLHLLGNPSQSLSNCFSQLESEEWKTRVEGLKTIQALARHVPGLLKTKLHKICEVVTGEVKSVRSAMACAAIDTLRELHVYFGNLMDVEVEATGKALLRKLNQTGNKFIHQQVDLALDALVVGCSPGVVLSTLLKTGLCHCNPAVKVSTAQHLYQMTKLVEEDWIFTTGIRCAESYLAAVSKMLLAAVPEVRHYGDKMLYRLVHHKDFLPLWTKVVPEKDRSRIILPLYKSRRRGGSSDHDYTTSTSSCFSDRSPSTEVDSSPSMA